MKIMGKRRQLRLLLFPVQQVVSDFFVDLAEGGADLGQKSDGPTGAGAAGFDGNSSYQLCGGQTCADYLVT